MTETGRPTALGVARSRFVEGLPRKAAELRASLALLVGAPTEERPREELRRRLHALWASAQVFQIEALCDALRDVIERLDRARDARGEVPQEDLDALAALAATLPLLGGDAVVREQAVPSVPPPASAAATSRPRGGRLRPPNVAKKKTLLGMARVSVPPPPEVSLDGVHIVCVVAPRATFEAALAAFPSDPRVAIHAPDPDEALDACLGRLGPDLVVVADEAGAATVRADAERIGALVRVLGPSGIGTLPDPSDGAAFRRALLFALHELPDLEPEHIAARLADLEAALGSSRAEVSNRFDGIAIGALLARAARVRPDASLHLRDAYDAIDAELRAGALVDALRTASDGGFMRGERALVAMLGMRRGLITLTHPSGPARKTLPDEGALEAGRERLAALEWAIDPERLSTIATAELDADAAGSAKKDRSVDPRVLDAVVRIREIAPLLGGGTSREAVSLALRALARVGAVLALRGPAGEDRLAEALEAVRREPPPEEPTIRWLTQAPPPARAKDDGHQEDALDDEPRLTEALDDERSGEPSPPARAPAERSVPDGARALEASGAAASDDEAPPVLTREPTSAEGEPGATRDVAPATSPLTPSSADEATRSMRRAETPRQERPPASRERALAPTSPSKSGGPPSWLVQTLAVLVLFLLGFAAWRFLDGDEPTLRPARRGEAARPAVVAADAQVAPAPVDALARGREDEVTASHDEAASSHDEAAAVTPSFPGAFGVSRANATEPPSGHGWVVADESGWRAAGQPVRSGVPLALPAGVVAVERDGDPVQVRFILVRGDRTVALAEP